MDNLPHTLWPCITQYLGIPKLVVSEKLQKKSISLLLELVLHNSSFFHKKEKLSNEKFFTKKAHEKNFSKVAKSALIWHQFDVENTVLLGKVMNLN